MANRWLLKEEPDKYAFADLVRDRSTRWDGVRNNAALKHMRTVRRGDLFLYYHTGKERSAVGIGRVVSDPYRDPLGGEDRLVAFDVEPLEALPRPVTLAELKAAPEFADSPLVRQGRLSVVPLTGAQWRVVERLAAT